MARRQGRPLHVVLGVRRRENDSGRFRRFKEHPFERAEPRRIQVFHNFDDCRRVESGQPAVAIHERPVQQADSFPLLRCQAIELEPRLGEIERSTRYIHSGDLRELVVRKQLSEQPPLTASEIEDARSAGRFQRLEYRFQPTLVEANRAFNRRLLFVLLCRDRLFLRLLLGGQSRDRVANEASLTHQVARDDHVSRRMLVQPAFTMTQELLDFVVSNTVVLLVVQYWDQHVQVRQQLAQAARRSQRDSKQPAGPKSGHALVEFVAGRLDVVAERLEERTEKSVAAAARYRPNSSLKR